MNTVKDFAIFAAKTLAVLIIARQFAAVAKQTGQIPATPATSA